MTKKHILYIVAKAPSPRVSKTRLSPPLSDDQAAELASAFLMDTLATVERVDCEARLICRTAEERKLLLKLAGSHVRIDVQEGDGLGAALESAFTRGLGDANRGVAVLGTDSPTLSMEVISQAFAALNAGVDVALGPCDDGGYYLLAARRLHLSLFRDMPWSTDGVTTMTLSRCLAAGLSTHVLPTWYDVDDVTSLKRLEEELLIGPMAVAPSTRAALASWGRLPEESRPKEPTASQKGAA